MPTHAENTPAEPASLRAERLLRGLARDTNRLLGGARIRVAEPDPAVAHELRAMLRGMGARISVGAPGEALDAGSAAVPIAFADSVEPAAIGPHAPAAARIDRARAHMPATAALAARLRAAGVLRGIRVGVSLVLEPKTAVLALALRETGAEVAVFGAVRETDPAVARELAARGLVVFAPDARVAAGAEVEHDRRSATALLDWGPELLIDDGAHLIRLAHTERPDALAALRGASEETTSGVRPLAEMQAAGALRIPVIAANDARTKILFDNRIGTGQSCVLAVADLLDSPAAAARGVVPGTAGAHWAVIGYGPVGEGVARFAAALGARVTVVERDPVRALAAVHDGHEAAALADALPTADVVVSATGVRRTVDAAAFARLRPGAAVAVAGGVDDELALDELRALGWRESVLVDHLAEWRGPGSGASRGVLVLAAGGGVNYTAAEGNPIEAMDLSFATQLAAVRRLAGGGIAPGLHRLTDADEREAAAAALAVRGGATDPFAEPRSRPEAAPHWRSHRYRSDEGNGA